MRRLQLLGPEPVQAGAEPYSGHHLGDGSSLLFFFVCAVVVPAVFVACTWPWRWRWKWCGTPSSADGSQKLQEPRPSLDGQAGTAPLSEGAPPAWARQDSPAHGGAGGSTAQNSTMTTDDSMPTARPGQPANPVSLPTQQASRAARAGATPKAAPGPSYESDDEGEGRSTAQERLNDITRSVKGHANAAGPGSADEAVRRQAEEAAKRLAAERGLPLNSDTKALVDAAAKPGPASVAPAAPSAASGPAAAATTEPAAVLSATAAAAAPAAPAPPVTSGPACEAALAVAAPGGVDGGGPVRVVYEIDLDIDLTKGDLKVDYSTRGLLGQGGFAAVYKGRFKGQRVAVKMIKKTAGSSLADLQEDMNALMHELHILRQVNHPNIVTLFGGCLRPPHIFLVEERMEGTLDFYIHQVRKHDALSVREVVYFALDIACGLSYLHPRIVHRDLKPANVLLSREGRCKISDFGLARTKMKEYLSTKNLDAGTTAYIAPECFMSMDNPDMHDLRRSVTDRTDVYALGIIMWEMLAGKRPWQGLKPLLVAYQVAYRSLRPPLFELGSRSPAKLRQLIEECWCQEPKQRPSSQQVVDRLLEVLNELPPEQDYPTHSQPARAPATPPAAPGAPAAQLPAAAPVAHAAQPPVLPGPRVAEVLSPQDVKLLDW